MNTKRQSASTLQKSKKIKKTAISSPQESSKIRPYQSSKYKTFSSSVKKSILTCFRKAVASLRRTKVEAETLSSSDLLEFLGAVKPKELNQILGGILHKHEVNIEPDLANLRRWRRKIKEWILSSDKPETRGSALIPHDKLVIFKEYLTAELRSMTERSLIILRQRLKHLFKKLDISIQNIKFSKHWWYDFINKHPDIKDEWENLPRGKIEGHRGINEKEFDDAESSTQMEVETAYSLEEEVREPEGFEIEEYSNQIPIEVYEESLVEERAIPREEDQFEDITLNFEMLRNSQVCEDEKMMETLALRKDSIIFNHKEDPLSIYLQSQPLCAIYRTLFVKDKKGIEESFEAALGMNIHLDDW